MIKIATFPRSGHHWLMNTVQDCCKLPCNWHKDLHLDHPGPDCLVAKTHDFELNEQGIDLVQWRDPVPAICSWYELGLKHGDWPDFKRLWRQFAVEKMIFAANFWRRHVQNPSVPVIRYENLCVTPNVYVGQVADLIGKKVLRNLPPSDFKPRKVTDFRHYDEGFFLMLEELFAELTK